MTIKVFPNDTGHPKDKLADVEIHFSNGSLAGLKLSGFSIWRSHGSTPTVRLPSRTYISDDGSKREFVQLRPIRSNDVASHRRLVELILQAFDAYREAEMYGR
jgi:hypothetical protein